MKTVRVRQVNSQIQAVYLKGKVTTPDGKVKSLESAVNPIEGKHLYDIVRLNGFTRTMEVGMANGMSGMYMAQVSGFISVLTVVRRWQHRACCVCALCRLCVWAVCVSFVGCGGRWDTGEGGDSVFVSGRHPTCALVCRCRQSWTMVGAVIFLWTHFK
jgi:hypothetical protein